MSQTQRHRTRRAPSLALLLLLSGSHDQVHTGAMHVEVGLTLLRYLWCSCISLLSIERCFQRTSCQAQHCLSPEPLSPLHHELCTAGGCIPVAAVHAPLSSTATDTL